jgi:hypothetical protein
MNCNDFQRQFHHQLDQRDRSFDDAMQQHMRGCDHCRGQIQLWDLIEHSVQSPSPANLFCGPSLASSWPQTLGQFARGCAKPVAAMAVAASLLWMIFGISDDSTLPVVSKTQEVRPADLIVSESNIPSGPAGWQSGATTQPAIHPALLWNDLRQRDWLGETMPTVHYVRDGVAPLGRSIKRAATLLTTAPEQGDARGQAT